MRIKLPFLTVLILFLLSQSGHAHVNLTKPEGGESYDIGETVQINWEIEIDHGPCVWDVYFSENGGESWDTLSTGIEKSTKQYNWTVPDTMTQNARIKVVQNNDDYANVSDESGNFSIGAGTPTSIQSIPLKELTLKSIQPNPFQSSTQVNFEITESTTVNISIYNIQGRKIETITERRFRRGNHQVEWNTKANIPAGIYLCRIAAGNQITTRRLVHRK